MVQYHTYHLTCYCRWWAQSIRESKFFSSQIAALSAVQNIKPEALRLDVGPGGERSRREESKQEDWWVDITVLIGVLLVMVYTSTRWTGTTYKGRSFAI
jgi:hypothetical protein